MPILIIGRGTKPRYFKEDKRLPTEYVAQSKTWMTSDIFNKWLDGISWTACLQPKGER